MARNEHETTGRNAVFDDVLIDISELPNVIEALDSGGEIVPTASRGGNRAKIIERVPANPSKNAVTIYRDPADVKTIFNLTRILMVLAVIIVGSGAANMFQYLRRPDRIVVNGATGRVLSINDRNYGKEENVEFGPDRLTAQDKLYATREFVQCLYQVDPATRMPDMKRALTMMVPDSAVKFSKWLKEKGVLDQQAAESWQAVWTPMDITVDSSNPYRVSVIGRQEITKVVNGATQKETKQLRLAVELVADPTGRADRNLRSGFLISSLDTHELPDGAAPTAPAGDSQSGKRVAPVTALQDSQ
jgi:hypothetical protein